MSHEAGERGVSGEMLSAVSKKKSNEKCKQSDIFMMSNSKFEDRAVARLVHLQARPLEISRLFPSFCSAILGIFALVFGLRSFPDCN